MASSTSSSSSNRRKRDEESELAISSNTTIQTFLDLLDELECSSPDQVPDLASKASLALVRLKSLQGTLWSELGEAEARVRERKAQVERQKQRLANLQYEQGHLEAQLASFQDYALPHLERICLQECEKEAAGDGDNDEEMLSTEQTMNLWLCGSAETSYQDPKNNNDILAKLHQEIHSRGTLEREMKQAQIVLNTLQQQTREQQQFLRDLPKKVDKIEHSSLSLQKFFSSRSKNNPVLQRIGSSRTERLELARELPPALYTLFLQLQAYLDQNASNSPSLPTLEVPKPTSKRDGSKKPSSIQLLFPLPTVIPGASATKLSGKQQPVATVELTYHTEWTVVTAHASGPNEKLNAAALLSHLFPNDDGSFQTTSTDGNDAVPDFGNNANAKPYHWCNYWAGLHNAPVTAGGTNIILTELAKRVRSNSTLAQILHVLERKRQVPLYPDMTDQLKAAYPISKQVKLLSFKKRIDGCYILTIQKTGSSASSSATTPSSSLDSVVVTIDMVRYPAVRPQWSLAGGGSSSEGWGQQHGSAKVLASEENPLYNADVGNLHDELCKATTSLVDERDEASYNYILTHQLHAIMSLWESKNLEK